MQYEQGSTVPNITNSNHPYMVSLYERLGMGVGDNPQTVLDCAERAWNSAAETHKRVEAMEALIGRRVDGMEIGTLDGELRRAVFHGAPFEVAYAGVARTLELWRSES